MAEAIKLRVSCHACGNLIEGTAKYGTGHYVEQGVHFEFVATGKILKDGKRKVKGEVTCVCPNCKVINKYNI